MYSRHSSTSPNSDFPQINPFADQSPFFLFYNGSERQRMYYIAGLGCVTWDLFQATRYEIASYRNDIGRPNSQGNPKHVTMPVCVYQNGQNAEVEFYAGNQRIQPNPANGETVIYQAMCEVKQLARPKFRGGFPFGAIVQTGTYPPDNRPYIAVFGIDLLFYPQGNARIPDTLEGFTRIGINHFTSLPRC